MRWTAAAVAGAWMLAAATAAGALATVGVPSGSASTIAVAAAVALVPLTAGAVVATRRPGHPAGALLAAAGTGLVAAIALGERGSPVFAGTWMLLYLPSALVLLTVPDVRTAPSWTRPIAATLVGVVVAFIGFAAVAEHLPAAAVAVLAAVLLPAFLLLLVACAATPILRYRHSDGADRLRLRWMFLAGASLPVTLVACWVSWLLLGGPDLVVFGLALSYAAIPSVTAVSLVCPDRLDVDRIAVAAATTTALAFAALGVLSGVSAVVGTILGDWPPVWAAAAAATLTLTAVAGYRPLRGCFDRALYPTRARTVRALRLLAVRVERGEAVPEDVEQALRDGMRDPDLAVGYRLGGGLTSLSGSDIHRTPATTPVRVRAEDIGAIMPSTTHAQRPARDVVRAATPLMDAARARAQTAQARAAAEESDRRLVHAGYRERRRLERDLHDGAQQRLVALGMRLRVLQRGPNATPPVADALDAAVAELTTAVAELRQLAHGVRPRTLDDGLAAALTALVRSSAVSVDLRVQADGVPDAPALTAYFVVSEALANALRHAGARAIRVSVCAADETLRVEVADDGRGGARPHATGGLAGLADRVSACGGRLRVRSPAGAGTIVEAVLPCGS